MASWGEFAGGLAGGMFDTAMTYIQNEKNRAEQKRAAQEKARRIYEAGREAEATYQDIEDMIREAQAGQFEWATPEQKEMYQDLVTSYEPQTYDFDKFSYGKTAEDFLNPEAEKIAELAGLKKQAELAGMGASRGTAADAALGYSKWEAAEKLYNDAQQALREDRSQAYQEYGDYIDRMQRKLDTLNQGTLNKINLLGGNISQQQQAELDLLADLIGVKQDKAQTEINTGIAAYS